MTIKAVIFDFDGVIGDTRKAIYLIYKEVCREMGKKFYGSLPEFTRNLNGNYMDFYSKLGISGDEVAKANDTYKKYFLKFEKEMRPFGEMAGVLAALKKRGIKTGIASNTHEFIIRRLLRRFGFEKYIDVVVGGKDMDKLKPDPAQILLTIQKLGVKRSETVFVGDMEVDMLAGRAAGVAKLIAVTYGYHTEGHLEKFGPDAIVNSPQKILENL
ncbi:HAD family hydrolase [Candidatus Micrarchaeota archaeon]|nr:HAD family hydrolase [Candidatus Micrarchaeota archaeon]